MHDSYGYRHHEHVHQHQNGVPCVIRVHIQRFHTRAKRREGPIPDRYGEAQIQSGAMHDPIQLVRPGQDVNEVHLLSETDVPQEANQRQDGVYNAEYVRPVRQIRHILPRKRPVAQYEGNH